MEIFHIMISSPMDTSNTKLNKAHALLVSVDNGTLSVVVWCCFPKILKLGAPEKFLQNVVGHIPIEDALYKCIIISNITVLSLQKSEEQFDNNS